MTINVIAKELNTLLESLGFMRKGAAWNRRSGSMVEVIDVQLSKANDSYTVNLGVLASEVYTMFWGTAPSEFVQPPECTVSTRIGELREGRDIWWQLNDLDKAIGDTKERIAADIVPFLTKMQTLEAMKRWLINSNVENKKYPPPILSLAIIKSLTGEVDDARDLLVKFHKKSAAAWKLRCEDIAKRLGFNLSEIPNQRKSKGSDTID